MSDPKLILSILSFLTEGELAERWGLTERSLQAKRLRNPQSVPPFMKVGKRSPIRYPVESVLDFEKI